jgi:hypothetical protein
MIRQVCRSPVFAGGTLMLAALAACDGAADTPEVARPAQAALAAQRTITGRIVYGTVNNDIGEVAPPTNFITPGAPVKHVWVELNDGAGFSVGSHDITNDDGRFSFTFGGTPNLKLVTKAKNDYVQVKENKGTFQNLVTDDVIKTKTDISGRVDYNVCLQGASCNVGTITVVSDTTDSYLTVNWRYTNYVSRAFYMTTAAYASGTHIEDLYGASLPGEKVTVRLGISPSDTPGWYWQLENTIYLPNASAVIFWHEYGHFVQDKIGSFALIPPYLGPGHTGCVEITDAGAGDPNPNLCWSYLEGLASWIGAQDSTHHYGSYSSMTSALSLTSTDPELTYCTAPEVAAWTDRRAVESIVANVLWDLTDDVMDAPNTTGIDEVAQATAEEVMAVVTAPMAPHTSCGGGELNSHPMGLDEFWDQWRLRHPGNLPGQLAVVPDLYAAYAFNGAAIGNAADVGSPAPVTLTSTSHVPGVWSPSGIVELVVTDGFDDVSGSYKYFLVSDETSKTVVATGGTPTFTSKGTVLARRVVLPNDADGQYIHVNTLDMAGHESTSTSHFGPLMIDGVDPYMTATFAVVPFRIDPAVRASDRTLMLGYPAQISWGSDDDHSGVATVRISFHDPITGFSADVHTTSIKAGTFSWYVSDVPVTGAGELTITVTDLAGNDIQETLPAPVTSPFLGPQIPSLGADSDPCHDGRVISADLNDDGYDDVVLVCRWQQSGHLYVLEGSKNGLRLGQDFPWQPADDLAAGDLDGDGDLDVVTVSLDAPGAATQVELLMNDGAGTLVDPGIVRPLGAMSQKTVRIIYPFDAKPPVVVVFGAQQPGNVPALLAFDVAAAMTSVALPGLVPVVGDWEQGDLNDDGYTDLVALGFDAAGGNRLSVSWGGSAGWTRQTIEGYGSVSRANVDVGDYDSDGVPDIFVMFEGVSTTRITKLLRATGAGFVTFAAAKSTAHRVAGGDGFIIDTANDAAAEVIAMGRTEDDDISGWYLRNDALFGTNEDTAILAMDPIGETDTAWGDFDGDGDLDAFQIGRNELGVTVFANYENQLGDYIDQNDTPKPPSNLAAIYDTVRGGYLFSWSAPPAILGEETPTAGLGYELRIGTTASGMQRLSWAHPAGASQQGQSRQRFVRLPQGSYWYEVRTVDSGWKRSLPSGAKQTTAAGSGLASGSAAN